MQIFIFFKFISYQHFFINLLYFFSVFATTVNAQQRVETEPKSPLATQEGQNVTLLCRYGLPIQLCRCVLLLGRL